MTGIKKIVFLFFLLFSSSLISACRQASTIDPEDQVIPDDNENSTPSKQPEENPTQEVITKMYVIMNENKLEITLANNPAVDTLIEALKQKDITITVNDYGGFEKVGNLGFTLPTSNSQITTTPGDVILYSGNQIVFFYGSNSWSYTRLGKIEGYSVEELRTFLKADKGSIQITLSLN